MTSTVKNISSTTRKPKAFTAKNSLAYLDMYISEAEFKKLTDSDCNLEVKESFTFRLIFETIIKTKSVALMDLLIERSFDLSKRHEGFNFLHELTTEPGPEAVDFIKYLVSKGASIELKSRQGVTPLLKALTSTPRSIEQIRYYLGQNATLQSGRSAHALVLATSGGEKYTLEMLTLIMRSPHYDVEKDLSSTTQPHLHKALLALADRNRKACITGVLALIPSQTLLSKIEASLHTYSYNILAAQIIRECLKKRKIELAIEDEKNKLSALISVVSTNKNKEGENTKNLLKI